MDRLANIVARTAGVLAQDESLLISVASDSSLGVRKLRLLQALVLLQELFVTLLHHAE
jgi:hypothetical protein